MSTTTENYGLIKPELTDTADITAMNENWEKIDHKLKEIEENAGNSEELTAHIDDKSNPHDVTAEQVGGAKVDLSNVDDDVFKAKVEKSGFSSGTEITASQTDITAGTTELADGALYLVYE